MCQALYMKSEHKFTDENNDKDLQLVISMT